MSWSIHGIVAKGVSEAKELLAKIANVPEEIKAHVVAAIHALEKRHGADVLVDVTGHGHLHDGEANNYDVTTATLTVQKSKPAEPEQGTQADAAA